MESSNILFARQPIYDTELKVFAYELLFRSTEVIDAESWDGDSATSQLVLNAFTEIGIDKASDNTKAFINFTRNWLLSPPPFEPRFVTVEILETVEPDDDVIAGVQNMRDAGFTIALDDFSFHEKWIPLLQLAHIVKIDVLEHQGKPLRALVNQLAPYQVQLLAEKVEDYSLFDQCKALGFEYFQGYFFCRPQNIHGDSLPSNKMVVMRLLAELQNPETNIIQLENIISNDISLSTKILKICNTPHYATRTKIDSIKRAVVLVGLMALKQWASIIALSRMSDKPNELIMLSLFRAKMMELLARGSRVGNHDTCFTIGMFSVVDAFFDQPKSKLLEDLPFDDDINQALLHHEGINGKLLQTVEYHETGSWDNFDQDFLDSVGIDDNLFEQSYTDALKWSTDIMQSLLS